MTPLPCKLAFDSYRFMTDTGRFSACGFAETYPFDANEFDRLGPDYFLLKKELLKRKSDLLNGIQNADCASCWYKESRGICSMRQGERFTEDPENFTKNYVNRIEIWNHNLCNFGCFMCNTGNSSTLGRIYGRDLDLFGGTAHDRDDHIASLRYNPERRRKFEGYLDEFIKFACRNPDSGPRFTLSYLGGEPTLHRELYGQAPRFAPLARDSEKRLQIDIFTNGSLSGARMARLRKLLGYYRESGWETCVMTSIDAVGAQAQVRFLSDIERVKTNWRRFLNEPLLSKLTSFTVLSNLNLPYIDKLAEFHRDSMENRERKDPYLEFGFNALDHPRWMQAEFLPRRYAEEAVQKARDIYGEIRSRWPRVEGPWRILESVANSLPEEVSEAKTEFYFSELRRIQRIYNRSYPDFRFAESFPHLVRYAKDMGMAKYL